MKIFFRKIRNIHFLSLFGSGFLSVINMVIAAVLYRSLNVDDNGTWIFYQTILVFVDTFRSGLIGTSVVKFYSGATTNRKQEVIGSTWTLVIIITFILAIANIPLIIFSDKITNTGLRIYFSYSALNLIISIPTLIALCKAQSDLRFDRILYLRVCNNGTFLISILILIYFRKAALQNVIFGNLISMLISGVISLFSGWAGFKFFKKSRWKCVKELYSFGKYTVAASVSTSLFRVTDTFVINFMLGPAALSIYNLGGRLIEIVELPLRSFTATALPALAEAVNQSNKSKFSFILSKYVGLVTLVLIPLLVFGFISADFLIGLIGGGKYHGTAAGNVFRFFISFALLSPVDRFLATAIDAIHKPQINLIKIIIMLVINFAADIAGVYITGNIYGIIIATFLPVLFSVFFSFFYLNKYYISYDFFKSYTLGFHELKQIIRRNLAVIYKSFA